MRKLNPTKACKEAFRVIITETYTLLYERKTLDQAHILKEIEQQIDRIVKAREALYSGAIDSDDFSAIKNNCEKRVNALGLHLQEVTTLQLTKRGYLEKLIKVISELSEFYSAIDYTTKREIIKLALINKTVFDTFIFDAHTNIPYRDTMGVFPDKDRTPMRNTSDNYFE